MPAYIIEFTTIGSGALANTALTLVSVEVPGGSTNRVRIRSLSIACDHAAPVDEAFGIKLQRGTITGTATNIAAGSIQKLDPNSAVSPASGHRLYTLEPSAYESAPLYQSAMNGRARLDAWWDGDLAPVCADNQIIGLLITPRAAASRNVSGHIIFETF